MSDLVIEAIAAVGVASSTLVTVELTDGRGDPIVGYVDGTPDVIILPTTVTTDANGEVTIDLIPNANIVPGNSCYTVRIAHKQFLIQKSGTTETLFQALVNDPGDLDPINTDFLLRANNLSDLEDPVEARSNLGLGDSATLNIGTTAGTVAAGDDPRFDIAPDHIADTVDAHDATAISFSPTVSIPADDVQEAIEYVMDNASGGGGTNDHNLLINRSAADQHPASSVTNAPAGTIAATTVQAAINELDGDIQGHITDTVDAHDATAISVVPFATIAATDVQQALEDVYASAVSGLDEASEISFAPTGDIVATNVQDAIVEVDGELHAHETDTVDAHDASAISFSPSGGITATDAQAAIVEALNDSIAYTDGAAVPKVGTYAATTTDVMTSKVTGDAFVRYSQDADGKNEWGSGSAALDTNLYRSGANQLQTDDSFFAITTTGAAAITATPSITDFNGLTRRSFDGFVTVTTSSAESTSGIAGGRYQASKAGSGNLTSVEGILGFQAVARNDGTGNVSDVQGIQGLVRNNNATGVIATASTVYARTPITTGVITDAMGVRILNHGTSNVVNAYGLTVEAQSTATTTNVSARIGTGTTRTLHVGYESNSTTAAGGITFGSSADTNLYRSAADTLKTDDSLHVSSKLAVSNTPNAAVLVFAGSTSVASFSSGGAVYGGNFQPANSGLGEVIGFQAFPSTLASGTVAAQRAVRSQLYVGASATVTAGINLNIESPSITAGGAITTAYGLSVASQKVTGVTTAFGIHQSGANDLNYFNGNVGLGTTNPTTSRLEFTAATNAAGGITFGADTNLYRDQADRLKTDDEFLASRIITDPATTTYYGTHGSVALTYTASTASANASRGNGSEITVDVASGQSVGSGSTAATGSIYTARATGAGNYTGAVRSIETGIGNSGTGTLSNADHLRLPTPTGTGTITQTQGIDVRNQGRAGVGTCYGIVIQPQSGATSSNSMLIGAGTNRTLWLGFAANGTTPSSGILFGSSEDTNLYRSAADTLKTDDAFQAVWTATDPAGTPTIHRLNTDITLTGASSASITSASIFGRMSTGSANLTGDVRSLVCTGGMSGTYTGTISTSYCGIFQTQALASGGTITNSNNLIIFTPAGTGTITTNNGFIIQNMGRTGTTTAIGLSVEAHSGASTTNISARIGTGTTRTLHVGYESNPTTAAGGITFGSSADTNLYRSAADTLKTDDKFVTVAGLGVGNSATATTSVGTLVKKIEVFDAAGASLGFIPVYSTIT